MKNEYTSFLCIENKYPETFPLFMKFGLLSSNIFEKMLVLASERAIWIRFFSATDTLHSRKLFVPFWGFRARTLCICFFFQVVNAKRVVIGNKQESHCFLSNKMLK